MSRGNRCLLNKVDPSVGYVVPDGCKIFFYKKGSGGEVVGVYNSIREYVLIEKNYNALFSGASIYKCLIGKQKYMKSFHHQCMVRALLRKVE